jgi:hypothetical protein
MLTEENHKEIINSYTKKDWKPLLDLIPEIESRFLFGDMKGGGKDESGFIQFPFWDASPVVHRFDEIVYELPIIINFDWVKWDEGREIVNDDDFNFNSIDIPKKCKILTAIVRSDRFSDGAIIYAFNSGLILKILKSIEDQLQVEQ